MPAPRRIDDDAPFDLKGTGSARARAALRVQAEEWAAARGHSVVDSGLRFAIEGVEVIAEFSRAVAEMCTLRTPVVSWRDRGASLSIAPFRLRAEPKSWSGRVAERLSGAFEIGDEAFDRGWQVVTADEAMARKLLDARVRWALTHQPIWCRLVHEDEVIEVLLDAGSDRLTGTHLLAGVEVAVAMALAAQHRSPSPAPYR